MKKVLLLLLAAGLIAGCNNEWPVGPIAFSYSLSWDAEGNLTPNGVGISLWDTYEMDFPGLRFSDLADTTDVWIDIYDNQTGEIIAVGELRVYSWMDQGARERRTRYTPKVD